VFFFDVSSPYSYLAATQIEGLEKRTGAPVLWRPFAVGFVFKETGNAMADELPNIALPKQFVVLDEFPKMGSGKIDFRTLTELVRQQLQAKD
jgi:2-hydroxychromene-2-carboxylate isomerase